MSIMCLDLATIPDFDLGARIYDLQDLSEEDISRVMFTKSRERENDIQPGELGAYMQRVLAISVLFQDENGIRTWSAGAPESNEMSLLQALQKQVNEQKPAVVTWNGNRSVFPVLNYRYLSHGIKAPLFSVCTDLMSEFSATDDRNTASLGEVAALCGLARNEEMSDDDVLSAYFEGNIELIRHNLDLKNINTWLINQRWQMVCGKVGNETLERENQQLKKVLLEENKAHLTNLAESLI
jgi:predicted PolB exonuclease-like 3'-5' exonuclease